MRKAAADQWARQEKADWAAPSASFRDGTLPRTTKSLRIFGKQSSS